MGVWRHMENGSRSGGRPAGTILVVQTVVDAMLVLSRKVGEKILIGNEISVTVVRVGQGAVRIGVEAPDDLVIVREEIKGSARVEPSDASEANITASG
jgi:carbon storage regulator